MAGNWAVFRRFDIFINTVEKVNKGILASNRKIMKLFAILSVSVTGELLTSRFSSLSGA
jgi:hypothetical protein